MEQVVCGESKREGFWEKKNNIEQKATLKCSTYQNKSTCDADILIHCYGNINTCREGTLNYPV